MSEEIKNEREERVKIEAKALMEEAAFFSEETKQSMPIALNLMTINALAEIKVDVQDLQEEIKSLKEGFSNDN